DHWILGQLRPVKDYDLGLLGPGSVLSSLGDMARYADWLVHPEAGDGARVLRPETLAEMMSPQFSPDPRIEGLGLAFFLDRFGAHRVLRTRTGLPHEPTHLAGDRRRGRGDGQEQAPRPSGPLSPPGAAQGPPSPPHRRDGPAPVRRQRRGPLRAGGLPPGRSGNR